MAVIQKIRENSAVTLIVIGGAVLAFILTTAIENSGRGGNDTESMVGAFEGVEISDKEFNSEREKIVFLTNGGQNFNTVQDYQKGQFTSQAWNSLLRDKFLDGECEELGITITRDEKEDMLIGSQPSPFFINYLFGGVDLYEQNRKSITENPFNVSEYGYMAVRDRQGNEVKKVKLGGNANWVQDFGYKLRTQNKFQNLLSSCFYTTTSLAKEEYTSENSKKDVQIAYVNYGSVTDENLNPTQAEIAASYEEIKNRFIEKEASRKVLFAKFDLIPSEEDRIEVQKNVFNLRAALNEEEDAKLFIKNETEGLVDFNFYKRGDYPIKTGGIDTVVFNFKKGDVVGPFSTPNQSQYGIAKILDKKKLSDSVKINIFVLSQKYIIDQIDISDVNKPTDEEKSKYQNLYKAAEDSIFKIAKSKGFKAISKELWADSAAFEEGGNKDRVALNNLGQNFLDSAISSKNGDIKFVYLPDGRQSSYRAIVEFVKFGKKFPKMQIGTIIKNVNSGDATIDDFMSRANQVAFALKDGKSIDYLTDSLKYYVDSMSIKGSTYTISNILDSRKIVNWAFETEMNQPSNVFTTPNSFVVAIVTSENEGEYKSIEDRNVKFYCERHARNKKQREAILAKLPVINDKNFDEFSSLYAGGKIKNERGLNLKKGSTSFGREAKVTGAIAGLNKGEISDAIEGEDGIYFIKVTQENNAEITEETNLDIEKNKLKENEVKNSNLLVEEFINEKCDLFDNRQILR
jgi:peptidyl-prolyl cis-trans isomerase D